MFYRTTRAQCVRGRSRQQGLASNAVRGRSGFAGCSWGEMSLKALQEFEQLAVMSFRLTAHSASKHVTRELARCRYGEREHVNRWEFGAF